MAEFEECRTPTPHSGDDSGAEQGDLSITALPPAGLQDLAAAWRVAGSLLTLLAQVNAMAPGRSKASDGTIGDVRHQGEQSDHNPWVRDGVLGVVTALDVTHDPASGCDCVVVSEALLRSRDPRLKYVIWDRKIFSSTVSPWTWRPYAGESPHTEHVHVSVASEKARYDDSSSWRL